MDQSAQFSQISTYSKSLTNLRGCTVLDTWDLVLSKGRVPLEARGRFLFNRATLDTILVLMRMINLRVQRLPHCIPAVRRSFNLQTLHLLRLGIANGTSKMVSILNIDRDGVTYFSRVPEAPASVSWVYVQFHFSRAARRKVRVSLCRRGGSHPGEPH